MEVSNGSFWRSFLGIFVGFLSALIIIQFLEGLGHRIFPMPEDLNLEDMEAFSNYVKQLSFKELLPVLLAHFLSAFIGCMIGLKIARGAKIVAYFVGGLVLLGALMNLYLITHPLWFMVADVLLVIIGVILALGKKN